MRGGPIGGHQRAVPVDPACVVVGVKADGPVVPLRVHVGIVGNKHVVVTDEVEETELHVVVGTESEPDAAGSGACILPYVAVREQAVRRVQAVAPSPQLDGERRVDILLGIADERPAISRLYLNDGVVATGDFQSPGSWAMRVEGEVRRAPLCAAVDGAPRRVVPVIANAGPGTIVEL